MTNPNIPSNPYINELGQTPEDIRVLKIKQEIKDSIYGEKSRFQHKSDLTQILSKYNIQYKQQIIDAVMAYFATAKKYPGHVLARSIYEGACRTLDEVLNEDDNKPILLMYRPEPDMVKNNDKKESK